MSRRVKIVALVAEQEHEHGTEVFESYVEKNGEKKLKEKMECKGERNKENEREKGWFI